MVNLSAFYNEFIILLLVCRSEYPRMIIAGKSTVGER